MWYTYSRRCAFIRSSVASRLGFTVQKRLKSDQLERGKIANVIGKIEEKHSVEVDKISNAQSKGGFRFTLGSGCLSDEQRRFYEDNGFIIIRNLVAPRDLEVYKRRFQDIAEGKVDVPGLTVMKDVAKLNANTSEHVVHKIQELCVDKVLFSYCTLPQVLDCVSSFCGPNVTAIHSMLLNKPPDAGALTSRHPLHQDLLYFPIRPADRIVIAWTAMEKVTRENGCLVVIPGSHHGEILEHGYPEWEGGVNKWNHGVKDLPNSVFDKRVHLEMGAGDTVFFHPILIHGSGANRTTGCRKAISCTYAASECEYIDVEGSVQEPIAAEILEVFRKRFPNIPLKDFKSIFKLWIRQVRGKKVNL